MKSARFLQIFSQSGQVAVVLLLGIIVMVALIGFRGKPIPQKKLEAPKQVCPYTPGADARVIESFRAYEKNGGNVRYIQVRGDVPINKDFYVDRHYKKAAENKPVGDKVYDLYMGELGKPGEINTEQDVVSKYRHPGKAVKRLYFTDFKIIFAVHKVNGAPVESSGLDDQNQSATFWLTDIYQQESELKGSGGDTPHPLPDWILTCKNSGVSQPTEPKVVFPNQNKSQENKELQLEYFDFQNQASASGVIQGWTTHCKPAIYLYPKEKTLVNVKVKTKYLTYTDPVYQSETGWNVIAYPTGEMINTGKNEDSLGNLNSLDGSFDYLYYESKAPDKLIKKPTKGFVVEYEQLENLYSEILPKLGLNQTQTNDFISYWKKALHYSPYYFVGIMDQENINSIEPLEINPKPDLVNRVRIYFEKLDRPIEVSAPTLTNYQQPVTSYHVVEWGGMVKNNPGEEFTCVQ